MPELKHTVATNQEAVESLNSDTCPGCGAGKVPTRTLCGPCYGRLPSSLASALYRKLYEGYLEALQAALKYLSESAAAVGKCRACPAPIVFAKQAGKKDAKSNPLNAEPHPEGNMRLDRKTMTYDVLTGQTLAEAQIKGEKLYLSHFANCPNRGQFKKSTSRAA